VDEGQDLARRLIGNADVLIENFRPGTLERWGLGWEELHELNPRLVMARVTGFGQSGPYASQPGYGAIGEAMGGIRYIVGDPGSPPSRTGISLGDALAALFSCVGTLSALHARERTGTGQVVDTAIYEAVLAMMESLIPEYAVAGYVRERTGSILPNVAPSNVYPTRDAKLVLIAANQDTVFRRLAEAMGRPELADDERYRSHTARGLHQGELDDLIGAWTATIDRDELYSHLIDNEVPVGRIYTAADMLVDPHFKARDAIVHLMHPELGDFPMQNVTPRLSATPGEVRWLGPELGEHTDEVLVEALGLDRDALTELRSRGVI
jgi:formyl-CoA transferase